MHISYISPLSGWYLAQAQPDLTAKNPTHTRLEQPTGLEPALSAWKADVLTTNTIAAQSPSLQSTTAPSLANWE